MRKPGLMRGLGVPDQGAGGTDAERCIGDAERGQVECPKLIAQAALRGVGFELP